MNCFKDYTNTKYFKKHFEFFCTHIKIRKNVKYVPLSRTGTKIKGKCDEAHDRAKVGTQIFIRQDHDIAPFTLLPPCIYKH